MTRFELVVVGGGLAAARAIREYRAAGGGGRVALLTDERTLPYHRPPLSKRFLRGDAQRADVLVETEQFYADNDVEVLLGTRATGLDARERTVTTEDGRRFRFAQALIATGAAPRTLDVDGVRLPGVFTLRSLEDSEAIREAATGVRDAVVVGGGFIGMEVAASLTELGVGVTLLSRDSDLFGQLRSPEISEHLVELYRQRGVEVVRGDEVRAFRGRSALDTVELHAGRPIGAGLAVIGVGVRPAAAFLAGSGITLGDGIVVDHRFETNVRGVYAVGDVASFFDPLYERRRRIEHWSNASYQGGEVGKILAGGDGGYDTVSTFFTESFGLTLKVFGDVSQHEERVTRGSFADGKAIVFYFDGRGLVATLHTGQDEHIEETLKELIRTRARPRDLDALSDQSVAIHDAFAAAEPRVAAVG